MVLASGLARHPIETARPTSFFIFHPTPTPQQPPHNTVTCPVPGHNGQVHAEDARLSQQDPVTGPRLRGRVQPAPGPGRLRRRRHHVRSGKGWGGGGDLMGWWVGRGWWVGGFGLWGRARKGGEKRRFLFFRQLAESRDELHDTTSVQYAK